jgi:glycosyltransferase involved in cell wall biosynthesis
MKILYVTAAYAPAWTFGGVVAAGQRLMEELVRQGDEVTVYTTNAGQAPDFEGAKTGFCELNGVKVYYFKCDLRKPILSHELTKAAAETVCQFNIMHLAGIWQPISIGVRRAAVKAGCPYFLSPHGALDEWPRRQKRLKKFIYYLIAERCNISRAAGVWFTSHKEKCQSSRFFRQDQVQCVIVNGLDLSSWSRNADGAKQWRAEARIPDDRFLFLSVGRLHKKKGLELALRSLAPLRTQNWHFALVGNDEDGAGERLAWLARDLRLTDRVSFCPSVAGCRLPAIYSAGDLFVLPSYHENFGNVVLEALACQCPVLISDKVGAYDELHGIDGVQVRKRDLQLWTGAMRDAIAGKEEFKASIGNRDELVKRFSVENSARQMRVFQQAIVKRYRG